MLGDKKGKEVLSNKDIEDTLTQILIMYKTRMNTNPGETYIIRDCAASYSKFLDSEAKILDQILRGNSYNFSPSNKELLS